MEKSYKQDVYHIVRTMSFYSYVKEYRKEQSARGDLARDMLADREFPKKGAYENMLDYLESKNACDGAMNTFERVFREYELKLVN
jgi:uncharacterized protein YozE (UPF0346 family)